MAQQSARRGWKNQGLAMHHECAELIWFRSANSHTGPQLHRCSKGRTDGSIRLRAISFKYRLRLQGRPQMPDVLDGVQFGTSGRQRHEGDVGGHDQFCRAMPSGLIEDQDGMRARRDMEGDFFEVHTHGFAVATGHDDTSALALGRTDGTKDPG